jgi:hypothetical protein
VLTYVAGGTPQGLAHDQRAVAGLLVVTLVGALDVVRMMSKSATHRAAAHARREVLEDGMVLSRLPICAVPLAREFGPVFCGPGHAELNVNAWVAVSGSTYSPNLFADNPDEAGVLARWRRPRGRSQPCVTRDQHR